MSGRNHLAPGWIAALVVLGLLFVLIMIVLSIVIGYASRAALIGMTREVEETSQTSVASGWRLGRPYILRLFGIDLVIGIPIVIVAIVLVAIGLAPLLLLLARSEGATILAILLTVGLMLGVIALLIVLGLLVSILRELAFRQAILDGKGVLDSIRDGYHLARANVKHIGVMWLLLVVVGLVWGALLVPLAVLVLGAAAAPAVATYAASESAVASILVGLLFAIPGVLVLSALDGVYQAFHSAVWTLTYREL
ncbi:MAG: hypothetical protein FJ026_14965 [Chloroflexi bacterium]|nr:hypothetical protein [Chloroflexota bacterium]